MKKAMIILGFFCQLPFANCLAHPGIGIVKDSKGNIYYTDLRNVWKIDPVSQERTVIVTGVHTHELFIDTNDDLYGEHLWYNGERSDTWGHYVWCLRSNGKLDTIIKPSAGFLENYSFVRDSLGNMYWVQRFKNTSRIEKGDKDGNVTTLVERKFKNIRWMHATRGGTIYFIDLVDLYKIENGKLRLLAAGLQERSSILSYTNLEHNVYGIWLDDHENVYVAILGGQTVKKITAGGGVKDIVFSSGSWRPCNGVFDNSDNMWLMETNADNEVRVRKIDKELLAHGPSAITGMANKARPFVIVSAILLFIFGVGIFFSKKIRKRKKALINVPNAQLTK